MTEELISDALEWLDRVGGERIRQELYAVFEEDEPGKPLRRLSRLGILQQISPLLAWDDWLEQRVADFCRAATYWQSQASARPSGEANSRLPTVAMSYLALVSLRATEEEVHRLAVRLRLPKDDTQFLIEAWQLSPALSSLVQKDLSRSGIYRLLAPHADPVIFLCWLASEDNLVKGRLELYHSELSSVKTMIDGGYLKSMELPPGPLYTKILGELRDARLDGRVSTLDDEKEEVQRIIARTDTSIK
jgi:tRNA nucleotidyltransferase (CCA-adding enzyme)